MSRVSLLKTLWNQNRGLNILIVILLVANVAAYLVQSQVLDAKLVDLRMNVRDRQQELRKLQLQKNAGSLPVSALAQVENDLAQFQKMIPPEEKLSDLIGDLFKYAKTSKLDIKQVSYNSEWDEELDLLKYELQFSISGNYRQLKHFIHQLEGAERILIVSDISLSSTEGQSKKGAEVTLRLNVDTFFTVENR